MPSKGWSEKRAETLCDRLPCKARESSSRAEERSFRAGGRRGGRPRQWQASGTHLHTTGNPERGQKEGNSEAADQVLGLRATWEPPLSDVCANTQGSATLLRQGAPRPLERRLHTLHTKTHTTARAAGQPAQPGNGGYASTQAACGEGPPRGPACAPRASPLTSPQRQGEGNEATTGDPPPPGETRQAPTPTAAQAVR